jgi:hypothetical protein
MNTPSAPFPLSHDINPTTVVLTRYRFDRGVNSITDLWREWNEGLGVNPSIEHLD